MTGVRIYANVKCAAGGPRLLQGGTEVPILEWLKTSRLKVLDKCLAYLEQLERMGHELRRPLCDFLGDGIYELRPSYQGVHYRILYFFAGQRVVVVSHGLKKEGRIPAGEIRRAMERKRKFETDPKAHTFRR